MSPRRYWLSNHSHPAAELAQVARGCPSEDTDVVQRTLRIIEDRSSEIRSTGFILVRNATHLYIARPMYESQDFITAYFFWSI